MYTDLVLYYKVSAKYLMFLMANFRFVRVNNINKVSCLSLILK